MAGVLEGCDLGVFFEEAVDALPEGAGAFAVNDSDFVDAAFLAGADVFGDQVADFVWAKGV